MEIKAISYRFTINILIRVHGSTLGKNLLAFLQHLAAFGGQMRISRIATYSV